MYASKGWLIRKPERCVSRIYSTEMVTLMHLLTGTVSAAITDGVTVGHPCCNEPDCKVPLRKVEDEYCSVHGFMAMYCCVDGCEERREPTHRTCRNSEHRAAENARKVRGRRKTPRRTEAAFEGSDTRAKNSRKGLKGVFSRRWTHNEQLMVRPCGVVVGRATFYFAESMSGVKVSRSNWNQRL